VKPPCSLEKTWISPHFGWVNHVTPPSSLDFTLSGGDGSDIVDYTQVTKELGHDMFVFFLG